MRYFVGVIAAGMFVAAIYSGHMAVEQASHLWAFATIMGAFLAGDLIGRLGL